MAIGTWLKSTLFGNPNVFTFRILNPDEDVMYDDLLGPELVSEISVYPAQEKAELDGRILTLETEDDSITINMIFEIFNRHKVKAELIGKRQKFE